MSIEQAKICSTEKKRKTINIRGIFFIATTIFSTKIGKKKNHIVNAVFSTMIYVIDKINR